MSITPSIFKRPRVPYTAVGGPKTDRIRRFTSPLSILLLARGERFYRQELLGELSALPFAQILSVEGPRPAYDLEALSHQYPDVRFLLLHSEASPGERINLGVEEARSPLVLVLWSDMKADHAPLDEDFLARAVQRDLLCSLPLLKNPQGEILPSLQVPAMIQRRLKLLPWKPAQEGMRSLIVFDYCGLYSRRRFLQLGGYDAWMANPYWQKLDFGLRAALWGETLAWYRRFQLTYAAEQEGEDSTPDASYKLFFLKNMAVRFDGEAGELPLSRFPRFALRSDSGLFRSLREFREVRAWVHENRFRFKADVASLLSRWEMPE